MIEGRLYSATMHASVQLPIILFSIGAMTGCFNPSDPPAIDVEGSTTTGTDANTSRSSTSTSGSTSTSSASKGEASQTATTSGDTTSTTPQPGSDSSGDDPSTTAGVTDCDPYLQDCPAGTKCNPWADDGGTSWNAVGCFPVDPNPDDVGETCSVEGTGGVSGLDTCAANAMCWDVDPGTNEGTCFTMCSGSPAAPVCDDPSTSCGILNGGVLNLCVPACDPLLQSCGASEGCYAVGDVFVCLSDGSGGLGIAGASCSAPNTCDPGLVCNEGACSPLCDLSGPGCLGGTVCSPWYEGGAPPGFEDVGVCI